jgi:Ca2+/Na+ antiporter
LAKTGYGEMGVTGSVAGPLFNVLVGLGASLVKISIILASEGKAITLNMEGDKDVLIIVALSILIFNIVRLLIHSALLKFDLRRSISYIGFVVYIVFVGVVLYFTFFY